MRTRSPRRLLPLWFALGGLVFSGWLTLFFHDDQRPTSPQERADRLAAANYAALSFHASSPPSPAHWAQMQVWQNPATGDRQGLARESAALLLAATGGRDRVAGVLAFSLAAGCLGLLLRSSEGSGPKIVAALALLGVAHGRAWQMSDPFPYLVLASAALSLCGWLRLRGSPSTAAACQLGCGSALLLLCNAPLFVIFLAAVVIDAILLRREGTVPIRAALKPLKIGGLALVLAVAFLLLRNHATTGSFVRSPQADYIARNVSAPVWFWQSVGSPQPNLDPVLERYDELVAIPAARWANPVFTNWSKRLAEGAAYAGGILLVLASLAAALALPAKEARPAWLTAAGLAIFALVYYPFSSSYWTLATGLLVALAGLAFSRLAPAEKRGPTRRVLIFLVVLQISLLPEAPQARLSDAEYGFAKRMKEVSDKISEKPGQHLVFASLDSGADPRLEPSDLGRDWQNTRILYARDLDATRNAELVAAMPNRTAWRIVIFRDRIGLMPWKPAAPKDSSPAK